MKLKLNRLSTKNIKKSQGFQLVGQGLPCTPFGGSGESVHPSQEPPSFAAGPLGVRAGMANSLWAEAVQLITQSSTPAHLPALCSEAGKVPPCLLAWRHLHRTCVGWEGGRGVGRLCSSSCPLVLLHKVEEGPAGRCTAPRSRGVRDVTQAASDSGVTGVPVPVPVHGDGRLFRAVIEACGPPSVQPSGVTAAFSCSALLVPTCCPSS